MVIISICDCEEWSVMVKESRAVVVVVVVFSSLKKRKSSQGNGSAQTEEFTKEELKFWYWKKDESKSIS